ncbi:MAG: cysteine--tRNA ligase [Desulfatibacillaceae bacterium]|nr:cysteine--tRNA ligase [Desulfatibacillaceae bacterium]
MIRLYNTLSRQKEDFEPVIPGRVRMYVCGPTVYDSSHMGHARSAVVFDVVFRYFEYAGFEVTYVRNFTDIDDKIIKRANETGLTVKAVASRYIKEFHQDMDALFVRRATVEPLATAHIGEMIAVIKALVEKGHAYEADGDVYFAVESFPQYGKLSGRKLDDMEAGARVEVSDKKKNPFDFVLWKAAKPDEPQWKSPWGPGRPGWHIECSAMGKKHLGESFDIHGGGKDLVFPHHENEIAQSEAAFGVPFARYWMHNGFVNIDSEKMSKSLGNFLTVRDILKEYHPEAVRLFLLSKHYRSPVDFTAQAMADAAAGLDRLYEGLARMAELCGEEEPLLPSNTSPFVERFCQSMDDDFNTAGAIGVMFEAVRSANRMMDEQNPQPDQVKAILAESLKMGRILGLFNQSGADYLKKRQTRLAAKSAVDPAQIEALLEKRTAARNEKDWAKADQIRDELAQMGVSIKDGPEGTTWKLE